MKKTLVLLIIISFIWACSKVDNQHINTLSEPVLPQNVYDYLANKNVAGRDINSPTDNKTNNYGATLGRVLFYDVRLSINNATSCGSCHQQIFAFADNVSLSRGMALQQTQRNTPAIINCMQKRNFFWDQRVTKLEDMVTKPIQNHIEMGFEDMDKLAEKLKSVSYYPALFKKTFGNEIVTKERISYALAQFLRSMATFNSKSDKVGRREESYTAIELEGKRLFDNSSCSDCHSFNGSSYSALGSANIGLDKNDADKGIRRLQTSTSNTGIVTYTQVEGMFSIPSLRNIALSAPYMHDGRFKTLEEVINHYSTGIQANPSLSHTLIKWNTGQPVRFNFSEQDKKALIAFLNAFTDWDFIANPMFSDPFPKK